MIAEALEDDPLQQAFLKRLKQGRDIRVIISAENAATGVGKTTAAFCLARMWDVSGSWSAEKATLDPREFAVQYHNVHSGACLILDEAEQGLEKRRSMSQDILDVGHAFATLRYRQVFGIMTLPSRGMIDKRIAGKLTDYWLVCSEDPIGQAEVFRLGYNEVLDKAYKEHVGRFRWPSQDSHPEFQKLDQKKVQKQQSEAEEKWIHRDELEELKDNYWNKATQETTYKLIELFYETTDLSQSEIADAIDVSQPVVSDVVNSESFNTWYSSRKTALKPAL